MSIVTYNGNTELIIKLKNLIEKITDKSIVTTNDAKLLSDDICKKTKHQISYNTFRRLFNIVPSHSKPSLFTLNVCAVFCGYKSWEDFVSITNTLELNKLNVFLVNCKVTKSINFELLKKYSEQLGKLKEFHFLLRGLISVASEIKDYYFFKNIFTLPHVFSYSDSLKYEICYTCHFLAGYVKESKDLQKIAITHYHSIPQPINYFVEWYVDELDVSGFYGKLLDNYAKHKTTPEAQLFYHCLKCYSAYIKKNKLLFEMHYQSILKIKLVPEIHPIPIARRRTCEGLFYVLNKKNIPMSLEKSINNDIATIKKKNNDDLLIQYLFFISQGLYWCKQYALVIELINKHILKDRLYFGHWAMARHTEIQTYYAGALQQIGDFKKAKLYISQVNIELFEADNSKFLFKDYDSIKQKITKT